MKSFSFLATPTTAHNFTNPTTSLPPCPTPHKPNLLTLHKITFDSRRTPSLVTRCSTKPNADITNGTDKNPSFESDNYASSSASSSTTLLCSRGLVLDLGPANSWDSAEVGSPVVKRFLSDEEERWYMWYHGSSDQDPSSDAIGLAVSSNGIHWERGRGASVTSTNVAGVVLNCSKDWWAFDTMSIRPSEVVIMSSNIVRASGAVYWLYYTGHTSENVKYFDDSFELDVKNPERFCSRKGEVFKSLPGLAMSQDGRHWARLEGEHHSGALFDVGSENEWDFLFISSPQVVFHANGDLRMYYHSFDAEKGEYCIGMARSRDGIKWLKLGKILGGRKGCFDEGGAVNARVLKNKKDGQYLMVYEGVGRHGERSIGAAVSSDGLKDWRRLGEEAILGRSDGGWDGEGVGSPCLVQLDGEASEWRLYYRGVGSGGRTGIGLAISDGSDLSGFQRWTGFHI
ncbi:hypothetical protein EUGRSUZ_B03205 [Eucalyptus grandis]|uniref:Uncharacterized protein n=2 Tax=Eucalyptus grandis TaxID=71139 RepID=A0ACC3LX46_EUCGR|nr:hypothetical protein EUGRSUZ_B03205 [Eucalyptus grandis]